MMVSIGSAVLVLFEDIPLTHIVCALFAIYVSIVSYLRYLRANYIAQTCELVIKKDKKRASGEIDSEEAGAQSEDVPMDGVYGSSWRIHNLLMAGEMKFEAWMAMSARGLFLTYGIPSISSVLHKTGGFDHDTARRYADMELLIREFNENAPDGCIHFAGQPERAREAIYRINKIHDAYKSVILYRDMMYVLTVFMTTPYLWMESRWSWRRLTSAEKHCVFLHWVTIGELMGLRVRENFDSLDDVVRYKYDYEAKHMRLAKSNAVVAHSTVDFFCNGVIWGPIRPLVRPIVFSLMSILQEAEVHRVALALPLVMPDGVFSFRSLALLLLTVIVDIALTLKALITRFLLPPLPLSWLDRLVGISPVHGQQKEEGEGEEEQQQQRRTTRSSSRKASRKDRSDTTPSTHSSTFSSSSSAASPPGGCPFAMFRPTRPLDFNNRTYLPTPPSGESEEGQQAYTIGSMGPRHIAKGTLATPQYRGMASGKII